MTKRTLCLANPFGFSALAASGPLIGLVEDLADRSWGLARWIAGEEVALASRPGTVAPDV